MSLNITSASMYLQSVTLSLVGAKFVSHVPVYFQISCIVAVSKDDNVNESNCNVFKPLKTLKRQKNRGPAMLKHTNIKRQGINYKQINVNAFIYPYFKFKKNKHRLLFENVCYLKSSWCFFIYILH